MHIYSFQPQSLIDKIQKNGFVVVEFIENNVYKQLEAGGSKQVYDVFCACG